MRTVGVVAAVVARAVSSAASTQQAVLVYNFSSQLPPTALDFFLVPFYLPDGVAELQVQHLQTAIGTTNILDWGIAGPDGSVVGWGGGNTEVAIVGVAATSRSYNLPTHLSNSSYLMAGNWSVIVGKPRIATPPGSYSINVTLLSAPSLPAQPQRMPYTPSVPLAFPPAGEALAWYAGDFHIHSRESGDAFANASHDEIAAFASGAGLDFAHFSEHNTVSTASFLVDAQSRWPHMLLLPGVEYTTYHGHAGALFTTQYVDHRIGNTPNMTIEAAAAAVHAQGGLFSINHIDMYEGDANGDLRNGCVGCSWDFGGALAAGLVDAMEVAIQSWPKIGWIFSPQALNHWDQQHALGYRQLAPIGGSDDHHGGQEEGSEGSPIGSPTTMVLAANLSHAALREGVALGRTAVKMFNALDANADLTATVVAQSPVEALPAAVKLRGKNGRPASSLPASAQSVATRVGGTVGLPSASARVALTATVSLPSPALREAALVRLAEEAQRRGTPMPRTGSEQLYVALVRNNEQTFVANVTSDPFTFSVTVPQPQAGIDRWRAEVHDGATGVLHTITNHIFVPAYSWQSQAPARP